MRSLAAFAVVLAIFAAGCSVHTQPVADNHGVYGSSPSNPMAEGDVTRVDPTQRVIVLSNGQMYQVPADSMVYVNGQPVVWSTVQPGSHVVLTQGQLVELRDGRYAVVQAPAVVTPGTVVAPGTVVTPGTVVAPAPGTVVATPAAQGVRQTIYGRVTDVDRNEIKVAIPNESFEIQMTDPRAAGIRKGDTVQLDVTIVPGSPSALPRR